MLDPFPLYPAIANVVRQALDLFGKLFIRCCEYGQVDIELFSFAVANMVRRMLNPLSLSPFVSLFRSGQANIGCPHSLFRSGQVNVGLCLLSHRYDFGQANVNSPFLVERADRVPGRHSSLLFLFCPTVAILVRWTLDFREGSLFAVANMVRWILSHSHSLFRSGQANVNSPFLLRESDRVLGRHSSLLFSLLSHRCDFGQVDIELREGLPFAHYSCCEYGKHWVILICRCEYGQVDVGSLLPSCSLFRSGQVSTEFSPFTVSIWSGECGVFLFFLSILLFRSGQADSRLLFSTLVHCFDLVR
ncbi:hypothetical protein KFK09_019906 [Dendrobium nobile]|uniref:Uncharacterized protein n=1 Tax=Dendrobium nobile TaxID=94219 RepID=A0A8T3AQU4_DENNO|nr:hypothetical protein KFK09_019906 [Dendrobium nobile]